MTYDYKKQSEFPALYWNTVCFRNPVANLAEVERKIAVLCRLMIDSETLRSDTQMLAAAAAATSYTHNRIYSEVKTDSGFRECQEAAGFSCVSR